MKGNSTCDTKQINNDPRDLKANLAKATNALDNLIRIHAKGGGISGSEVLTKMIKEREEARASIKAKISSLERERESIGGGKVDGTTMQGDLTDYLSIYETFDKDQKRQLDQILFSAVV